MTPYIPNCAVALLLETDFEEAPYMMCGTGFLLRTNSAVYFATAKHTLKPGDSNRLRVPRSFASTDLLELGQYGHVELPEGEQDTDWADFALFSVAPAEFGQAADLNVLEPATLPNLDTRHLLINGMVLTVRGYPEAAPLTRVDYDKKTVAMQPLTCDARLLRLTDSQCCYELQFDSSCPISDFNYMSGSPVFVKALREGQTIWILAGLMLRAGGPEKRGRFVSIEVIKDSFRFYANPQGQPAISDSAKTEPQE
jgi:hypothetical protein